MKKPLLGLLAWAIIASALPAAVIDGFVTEMDRDGVCVFDISRYRMVRMRFNDDLKKGLLPWRPFPSNLLKVTDIGLGDTLRLEYGYDDKGMMVIREIQMIKPANHLVTGIEPGG